MRFRDIPQYINSGEWECNYGFEHLVRTIEQWCNGEDTDIKLQMNPDFQRGHVWTEQQQIAFIESVIKGGAKNARVIYLNNPNWRINGHEYKDFVCVDGLQRYTAIKRFIKNEIKVFGYYCNEYEDSLRGRHDMKININDLPTKADVLQWYIEFNAGGTIHTEQEINRVKKLLEEELERSKNNE